MICRKMPDPATSGAALFETYKLGQDIWYRLVKRRHKVSFGLFIRSIEAKNKVKLSQGEKERIELDLKDRRLLVVDKSGHRWVLPKPTYSY